MITTDSLICTVIDGRAFVPIHIHDEVAQQNERYTKALHAIAGILNSLADDEEARRSKAPPPQAEPEKP